MDNGVESGGRESLTAMVVAGYDAWSSHYDTDMLRYGYQVPSRMADAAERHIPRRKAYLLDVGAGSGLVGRALVDRGYHNLVGLDPSMAMLRQAQAKSVYRLVIRMTLEESAAALRPYRFDGLVAAGVCKAGHLPPETLVRLARLVRPTGIVIVNLESGKRGAPYARIGRKMEENFIWRCLGASEAFNPLPGVDTPYRSVISIFQTCATPSSLAAAPEFKSRNRSPWHS